MRNAGLEEPQAGITIAKRNINNLRYADDTTLMAESEEELKSLLIKAFALCLFLDIMRNAGLNAAQESRLLGEISITSDMQMTPPLWQKVKRN